MKEILLITAHRNGYSPSQCGKTMTVGQLIEYLEDCNKDAPIYLSHDNGYTYGSINDYDISEQDGDEYED